MKILDIIFWSFAAFVVVFIAYTWLSMLFSRDRRFIARRPHGHGGGTGGFGGDMNHGEMSGGDSSGSDSGGGDSSSGGESGGGSGGGW